MSSTFVLDIQVPLDRFTLSVAWEASERSLGIFGHSGAGKTTILEAVAGLRRDARGIIRVDGETWLDSSRGVNRKAELRGVGYVPQDGLLFPHKDVMGNLLSGRRRAERSAGRHLDPERVLAVLELADLRRRAVAGLSGGERQRVALGRALCSGASLLLMDEPLAGLDAPLRRRILPYLLRVREEFEIPTLYVSHDAGEIGLLCAQVLVLSQGRALRSGPPAEVFTDPAIFPMARREGFENVLRGRVTAVEQGAAIVEVEPGITLMVPGESLGMGLDVIVTLRAEDLILAREKPTGLSAQNVLAGAIRRIGSTADPESSGAQVLVVVELGGGGTVLAVTITNQAALRLDLGEGTPVHLVFKAQACRALAAR
jgi:molybdate transport system ATP-binding protein